jgi:hypothetical protein
MATRSHQVLLAAVVLVALVAAGCGGDGGARDDDAHPTDFACDTWSLHNDPIRTAHGVSSPEQAAAPYVPDGAAVVTLPEDPTGARDVTFLAYLDDELVARVATANLVRGQGWFALSVRACS